MATRRTDYLCDEFWVEREVGSREGEDIESLVIDSALVWYGWAGAN